MIEIKAQKKPWLFDVERNLPIKITENGGNLFRKALVLKILFNIVKVDCMFLSCHVRVSE